MGLFLNKEVLLKLFAKADLSSNNQITKEEFTYAVLILKK
jgi:hypothetical protein